MKETVLMVRGMSCMHCVKHVQEALGEMPGVTGVDVQLKEGKVTVQSEDNTQEAGMRQAIERAGYEVG